MPGSFATGATIATGTINETWGSKSVATVAIECIPKTTGIFKKCMLDSLFYSHDCFKCTFRPDKFNFPAKLRSSKIKKRPILIKSKYFPFCRKCKALLLYEICFIEGFIKPASSVLLLDPDHLGC